MLLAQDKASHVVDVIQHLMITYLYMTDRQSVENRWVTMGLLAKLTYSVSIHAGSPDD